MVAKFFLRLQMLQQAVLKIVPKKKKKDCHKMIGKTYLTPWMGLNLWKFELCVIGVHLSYLLLCGCTKNLDDLNQLIHTTVSWEDWLTKQQLCKHTPSTPYV